MNAFLAFLQVLDPARYHKQNVCSISVPDCTNDLAVRMSSMVSCMESTFIDLYKEYASFSEAFCALIQLVQHVFSKWHLPRSVQLFSRSLDGCVSDGSTSGLYHKVQHSSSFFKTVTDSKQYGFLQSRGAPGERCWSILVNTGDTCESLSAKCGVSTESLAFVNPKITCSTLPEGKPVCCSAGSLSLPPKNVESRCYSYTIRGGDTCEQIAKGYSMTTADIETYNKETWAWSGCGILQEGNFMCLSSGSPPMPVTIADAVCGPQVPGTARPLLWSEVPSLNPCPAGQCVSPDLVLCHGPR